MRTKWLLLLALAFTAGPAFSDTEYSQAAGLAPLGSKGPEIRVWIDDVMFGTVHGFVVSGTKLAKCSQRWHWDDAASKEKVESSRCKPAIPSGRARERCSRTFRVLCGQSFVLQ